MLKAGLVVCLAFVLGAIVVLLGGDTVDPLAVALSGAFFGALAVVAGVSLLPGACNLELSPQGFVSTRLFRRRRYDWRDVVGFRVISSEEGPDVVGFDFAMRPPHRRLPRLATRIFDGVDYTLPPHAVPAVELAAAMNLWRRRYAPLFNEQLAER